MFLVGDDGIVPTTDDARNYAQAASHYFLDDAFTRLTPQRPGLPMMAWSFAQIGIPWKLAVDAILMLVAGLSGVLVHRWTRSWWTGAAVMLAIAFNPWFTMHARTFMTEPLTAALMLAVVLLAIEFACRSLDAHVWGIAIVAGIISGWYVLCRNELLLLAGLWGLVILVVLLRHGRRPIWGCWKTATFRRIVLAVLPVVIAMGMAEAVKFYNGHRFGVRALSLTEQPGFKSLVDALYRIRPEENIRFAPVTRQSLAAACDVSPTLNHYRDTLMDLNRPAYKTGARHLKLTNEFGTWLNWHLVGGIRPRGKSQSDEMQTIADEIQAALDAGQLPDRWAKFPIDPMWREWLPALPSALGTAIRFSTVHQNLNGDTVLLRRRVSSTVEAGLYDDGLLRRAGVGLDDQFRVFGDSNTETKVVRAELINDKGSLIAAVPVRKLGNGRSGFSITIDSYEDSRIDGQLSLRMIGRLESGKTVRAEPIEIPDDWLFRGNQLLFDDGDSDPVAERWLLSSSRYKSETLGRDVLRNYLHRYYLFALGALCGIAVIAGWFNSLTPSQTANTKWILFVGISFLLARCLFYSLIEVWLFWGVHRYAEPNVLLALVMAACLAFCVGVFARHGFNRFRPQSA